MNHDNDSFCLFGICSLFITESKFPDINLRLPIKLAGAMGRIWATANAQQLTRREQRESIDAGAGPARVR